MNTPTARQIAALELAIAIAFGGGVKPKSASQVAMVRDDAKACIEALKTMVKP